VHVKKRHARGSPPAPYRATVDFDKVYLSPATRAEARRETYVAHVVFVTDDHVDNARIPINPLGLTITYFREDQAFASEPGRIPGSGRVRRFGVSLRR